MCSCIDGSLPSIYNSTLVSVCMTEDQLKCILKSRESYFSSSTETEKCAELCPEECESSSYDLLVSNSRYPTTYNINYMKKQPNISARLNASSSNDNSITKTTLIANIFYSS